MEELSENISLAEKLRIACLFDSQSLSKKCLNELMRGSRLHFIDQRDMPVGQYGGGAAYDLVLSDTRYLCQVGTANGGALCGDSRIPLFLVVMETDIVPVRCFTHPLVNQALVYSDTAGDFLAKVRNAYRAYQDAAAAPPLPPANLSRGQRTARGQFVAALHVYIKENAEINRLAIGDVACHMGLSAATFRKRVKQATGMTAVRYVLQFRLRWAKDLLQHHGLTVQETALQTGFMSDSYFTKSFKTLFGELPSAYLGGATLSQPEAGGYLRVHPQKP